MSCAWGMPPMGKWNKALSSRWRETRSLRSAAGAVGGFSATVLFALYNGALGLWHSSPWHGSICVYYIILSLLRGRLLLAERAAGKKGPEEADRYERRVFRVTSGAMLMMDLALTVPAALMVLDRRPIQTGLIPAIASATYTTYKISAAAVKLKSEKGTVFHRELRLIRFADALVSVLVLQNTLLIAVDGGVSQRMLPLAALSSTGILLVIFAMTLVWLVRGSTALHTASQ